MDALLGVLTAIYGLVVGRLLAVAGIIIRFAARKSRSSGEIMHKHSSVSAKDETEKLKLDNHERISI